MDYKALIETLTPELVERLRLGVETGRWPDGSVVTPGQKEHSLQAIIAWEAQNLPQEERVGFINLGAKAGVGEQKTSNNATDPLRWIDDQSQGDE